MVPQSGRPGRPAPPRRWPGREGAGEGSGQVVNNAGSFLRRRPALSREKAGDRPGSPSVTSQREEERPLRLPLSAARSLPAALPRPAMGSRSLDGSGAGRRVQGTQGGKHRGKEGVAGAGGRDEAGRAVRAAELLPMNKAQGTPWGGENAQPPRSCGRRSRPSPALPSPVRCSALPNPWPASPGAPQASPPEEGPHSLSTKGSTVPDPILPTAPPCTGPRAPQLPHTQIASLHRGEAGSGSSPPWAHAEVLSPGAPSPADPRPSGRSDPQARRAPGTRPPRPAAPARRPRPAPLT